MRIALITGRAGAARWTHGGHAAAVVRGLVGRGHSVDVVCPSAADTRTLSGADVHAMQAHAQGRSDWPVGFAGWAERVTRTLNPAVTLSLTSMVAGDVWLPLTPAPGVWLVDRARDEGVTGLAKRVAKHPGVLIHSWRASLRGGVPSGFADCRAVCAIGAFAAAEASREFSQRRTATGESLHVHALPFWSTLTPLDEDAGRTARDRLRSAIAVPERQVLALASAIGPVGRSFDAILEGLARFDRQSPADCPTLAVLAAEAFTVHNAAVALGIQHRVRVLGVTTRVEEALAASDVAVAPRGHFSGSGRFRSGGAGRFIADALRASRPVLAIRDASGAELIARPAESAAVPGEIIDEPTPEAWLSALRESVGPEWMVRASAAAAAVAPTLAPGPFFDALESVLKATAAGLPMTSRNPSRLTSAPSTAA